ncbi:hypothetical protein HOE31_00715 [bacterium]|jgi:hypothetical protein|nr:hypothetical protein [bacterium]MBT4335453.1 hypothetical protein [bacterium]MBT4495595.1 hypothetical protein [bacterium]MBT4764253.1 hypothetical protein [bacterium]MBT5401625.1 hypothetical protein [bacterium]
MNSISQPYVKRLLTAHSFFVAGKVFFGLFMSVFIWSETKDINLVATFYITYLLIHTFSFTVFASLVKKGVMHFPRKLGIIGCASVYFSIFLLGDRAIEHLIPIAMGFGFFNGMYWISYHIFRFDYTKTSNRGNYTGTEKAIGTVIGIILPILGGYIIVQNFYNYGYGNVFLLGSFLYLVSFFIGNIPLPKSTHTKLHLRKTIKEIMKHKDLQKSMIVYFLGGFGRAGALLRILLPLLIFDILQNEFELGGWLSFFALISAFLAVLFGRHINYKHYKNFATIGGLLFFVSILSLIGFPILLTYIIFGIVKELGSLFLQIPKRVISENLVHQIDDYTHHRVEYIVIREWFGILFGRGSSYVLLLFVGSLAVQQLQYVLVIMAFAVIVEILFLRSINQESYK